jgi:hypothetical protein
MEEFDTSTDTNDDSNEQHEVDGSILPESFTGVVRRLIVLLSMGPGVLGLLWLFGRILRR